MPAGHPARLFSKFHFQRESFHAPFGLFTLGILFAALTVSVSAQTQQYDPRLTFSPLTLPDPVNAYRSSNGAPDPGYWQNAADYEGRNEYPVQAAGRDLADGDIVQLVCPSGQSDQRCDDKPDHVLPDDDRTNNAK